MGTTGGESAGGSGRVSGSDAGRPRSAGSGAARVNTHDAREAGLGYLCTFLVAGQRYALSTSLVREIVEVDRVTRVPRVSAEVMGLFNLRGEPMPLVDLSLVLMGTPSPASAKMSVIILRNPHLSVGARIDGLGTVVPNHGVIPTDDPNPILLGFLESPGDGPIAVIDPNQFMAKIDGLRIANTRGSAR